MPPGWQEARGSWLHEDAALDNGSNSDRNNCVLILIVVRKFKLTKNSSAITNPKMHMQIIVLSFLLLSDPEPPSKLLSSTHLWLQGGLSAASTPRQVPDK